jgi:hypothetical protein
MISKRMNMSGEILINSSEKLFKINSNLVMIALAQDGNATMLDKILGVQHKIA